MKLTKLTIAELHAGYEAKKFTVTEVVNEYLAAINKYDDKIKAYLTVTPESALARAAELDRRLDAGEKPTGLFGIPGSIKDVINTKGIRTTAGSKALAHYVPLYNATVVEKILKAGAVILGKNNCDEFAMGASNENSGFYPVANPWDLSRVPGGSSGGSAAAVAAGECLFALGTDTGGSIRQPAGFCGVVGVKPTYGRVSRYGLIAMTSSLDQAGPLTRTVEDAAKIMQVIAGQDNKDATTSSNLVADYSENIKESIKNLKIGVPKEFFSEGLDKYVGQTVRQAIDELTALGADVVSVSLPSLPYALEAYYIINPSEVSANMARFDGLRFGDQVKAENLLETYQTTRGDLLGKEVKKRIMLGTYMLSAGYYEAYYKLACRARSYITQEMNKVLSEVEVLVTPTSPTTAFALGDRAQDPLAMYLADIFTVPANIAGLPAISIPCGFVDSLPVGLQFIGRAFSEDVLFRLSYAYEQAKPWYKQAPSLD